MTEEKTEGWITRDRNGNLGLHEIKPLRRHNSYWGIMPGGYLHLNRASFPEQTWEKEPTKVEVTIKTTE